jgi:thiol-disulfide isomerase/thioredoxin
MKHFLLLLCTLALLSPAIAAGNHAKGAAPLRIAHGEQVDLADYLVPGKTTVFDFTSEFCPPCRAYDPTLLALHQQRADIAVVQVDINRPGLKKIDWQSPVAQQYGMKSIPHFKVYGPDGKLLAEGQDARGMVNGWISALK